MAASINDKITDTFNSANPNSARVTSTRTAGAASLACDNLAGWPTASKVHFVTYSINTSNAKVAGSQIDWCGIISGNNIGSMTRLAGASDNGNTIGQVVEMMPTASWGHDLYSGLTQEHNQDGTHSAVTATSVAAGTLSATTSITDGTATLSTIRSELTTNFVASGGVVAQSAGLIGTFSNIVYYISGVRYTANSIPNKTYTASKDTYVDINSSGTPAYNEVTNGAAAPALTAGYIRVAKVVTSGAAITSVTQSQNADSLGNQIRNTAPVPSTLVTNPYKFSAYHTSAQNTGNAAFAKIAFANEEYDTGSNYDSATNYRFTAPVAGFYAFNARIHVNGGGGARLIVSLFKNGSEVKRGNDNAAAFGAGNGVEVSAVLQLAANDYVEAYAFGSAALPIDTSGASTCYFQGYMVSAT